MTRHPCGALPVSGLLLNAWYCHHHQAWFASSASYVQTGSSEMTTERPTRAIEFGPFDERSAIEQWMAEQWLEHLNVSVRRGDDAGQA